MRVNFNASKNPKIDTIKSRAAEDWDRMDRLTLENIGPSDAATAERFAAATEAQRYYELACMMAVKAITA